jgi:HEAT repeat protein
LQNEKAAFWACVVLADIGPRAQAATPNLIQTLKHPEPEVRLQALVTLSEIGAGAKSAASDVAAVLADDKEPAGVRYAAAFALSRLDAPQAADAVLRHAAGSDDAMLSMISRWSLAMLHPDDTQLTQQSVELLIRGLESKDEHIRIAAARGLADLKAPPEIVRPALIKALQDKDPRVVGNAIDAVASQGAKVVQRVSESLQNKDLQRVAVRVLARIGPDAKAAVPALTKTLAAGDDDPELQREVQFALGAIGPEAAAATPELIKSLSRPDEEVQYTACYALGRIGPAAADATEALRNNLTSDDPFLRLASVWALLKIHPQNPRLQAFAVPLLIGGLQHEREQVRLEAATTLGELGQAAKESLPTLKKALEDESPLVRVAAAEAIERIGQ